MSDTITGRRAAPPELTRAGDKATVTLSFPNWLAPSRYTITPVIAVWDPHERILDRKEDLVSLIAESEVYSGGVTDIPTELELVRG